MPSPVSETGGMENVSGKERMGLVKKQVPEINFRDLLFHRRGRILSEVKNFTSPES
jgi:hypothetical protein